MFVNLVATLLTCSDFYFVRFVSMPSRILVSQFPVRPDAKNSNITRHVQLPVLRIIRQRTHNFGCRVSVVIRTLCAVNGQS